MRTTRSSSLLVVVVRPRRIDRQGRGGGIGRIRSHWFFVDQVFDTQRGDFRAAAATGSESRQKQRPIAQVDRALAGADLQQLGQDIAGHRLFALSLPRPGTGAHGKPQRPADQDLPAC